MPHTAYAKGPNSDGREWNDLITLIATDLDGTLLNDDRTVSARTRIALERVQAQGITVVLVTARPILTARLIALEAGVSGVAIVSNGAITLDLEKDPERDPSAILEHVTVQPAHGLCFVQSMRQAVSDVCFALVHGLSFYAEPTYLEGAARADHVALLDQVFELDALEFAHVPATKWIAKSKTLEPDALLAVARSLDLPGLELTHSNAPFIEAAAAGVTKARALENFCRARGISRDAVVAFGDAPNDAPMLEWAGHGVAVANAHVSLLRLADEIAPSNLEDGVAVWLEANVLC